MHQIRFRLGLRPGPRWGSLKHSPDTLAAFNGPTSEGGERRQEGREGQGRGKGVDETYFSGEGEGRGGRKGEGRVSPQT